MSRLLAEKYNELRDKLHFQAEKYGKWKSELKRQDELIEITIYEIDLIEDAIEKRLLIRLVCILYTHFSY